MRESRNDLTRHEDLARRIEPASTWADIAVGEQQLRELADSAAHVLQVSEDRQSEIKNLTDRGMVALFTGPSGTGKTMAAEVLARDLHLELYRIALTRVVSKYIGETPDALFGKRSEVKDSPHSESHTVVSAFLLRRTDHDRALAERTRCPRNAAALSFGRCRPEQFLPGRSLVIL